MTTPYHVEHIFSKFSLKLTVASICLAIATTGCTLDFEEFNAGKTPATDSDSGSNQTDKDGASSDNDADPGTDSDTDITTDADLPLNQPLGGVCSEDRQCGDEGMCLGGYCTHSCIPGANTCDPGSSCHKVGDLNVCVLDCDAYQSCTDVADRDDLGCVDLIEFNPGGLTITSARACLPDADNDRVFDLHDNCPDVANASQLDSDGDGIGDACDPEIYCHKDATDGYLEYPLIDYAPTSFSVPTSINGTWLPIVSGRNDNVISSDLLILDRANASWKQHKMPYRATSFAVAPLRDGNFLLSPGETPVNQDQIGATLVLNQNGQTKPSYFFPNSIQRPTMTTTALGVPVFHAYATIPVTSWAIQSYNSKTNQHQSLRNFIDGSRRSWHSVNDLQGSAIIYNRDEDFIKVSPHGTVVTKTTPDYPKLDDDSTIDPFILPAPGGQYYAFDRKKGKAVRFSPSNALGGNLGEELDAPVIAVTMPELDLDLSGLTDVQFVAMPQARSLLVIGRSKTSTTKIVVREYNFACMAQDDWTDTDEDGIPDIIDNCPFDANPDQLDTDQDGLGDACDPDRDGDGIPNEDDFILGEPDDNNEREVIPLDLDSDNDGIPNATDDDIDGDGIPNDQDRFPFDSANDGIPNRFTTDADGDGFSDADERAAGTNPYNQTSFPGSGAIVYIDKSDDKRVIKFAPLADFKAGATAFDIPEDVSPHSPQITSDKQQMLYLADKPGKTTNFVLYNAESTIPDPEVAGETIDIPASNTIYDARNTLRSITLLAGRSAEQEVSFLATHENPQRAGQWNISTIVAQAEEDSVVIKPPVVAGIPEINDSIPVGSQVYFLGGLGTCDTCTNLYYKPMSFNDIPAIATTPVQTPTRLFLENSRPHLIGHPPADPRQSLYTINSANNAQKITVPAEVFYIDSFRIIPGIQQHKVLAGAGLDGVYGLWFYNGVKQQWTRISNPTDDIVDISWIP